jgi:hypothetical protein
MRTRAAMAAVAVFVAGLAAGFDSDREPGTWKLNEAKSKFAAGAPR